MFRKILLTCFSVLVLMMVFSCTKDSILSQEVKIQEDQIVNNQLEGFGDAGDVDCSELSISNLTFEEELAHNSFHYYFYHNVIKNRIEERILIDYYGHIDFSLGESFAEDGTCTTTTCLPGFDDNDILKGMLVTQFTEENYFYFFVNNDELDRSESAYINVLDFECPKEDLYHLRSHFICLKDCEEDKVHSEGLQRGPGDCYDFSNKKPWLVRFKNWVIGLANNIYAFITNGGDEDVGRNPNGGGSNGAGSNGGSSSSSTVVTSGGGSLHNYYFYRGAGYPCRNEVLRLMACQDFDVFSDESPETTSESYVHPDAEFCAQWENFWEKCLEDDIVIDPADGTTAEQMIINWALYLNNDPAGFMSDIGNTLMCPDLPEDDDDCSRSIAQFEGDYGITLSEEEKNLLRELGTCKGAEALRELVDFHACGQQSVGELALLTDFAESSADLSSVLEFYSEMCSTMNENPSLRWDRLMELYNNVQQNDNFLIDECLPSDIDPLDYQDLFNHQLPQASTDVLDELGEEFYFQPIDDAHSPSINFDHYSVEITNRPDLNGDQQPDSNQEIFELIRANFLTLASGSFNNFKSECMMAPPSNISWNFTDYPGLIPSSSENWTGNSPLGTIFLIQADGSNVGEVFEDPGAVIVSDYQDCCWLFSTIVTPESGSQPFSGHRQFGIRTTENGLEFFTRATDRAKLAPLMKAMWNDACSYQDYFNIGDLTWTNLITNVKLLTEQNGGAATLTRTDFVRPKYEDIIDLLESDTPLPINCH